MKRHSLASLLVLSLLPGVSRAEADKPLLLQHPTLSKTQVVFSYGGDLWTVARQGGDAGRLTSGLGLESHPIFSPDGSQIAFAGEYEGNLDVYVIPAAGGEPRRLTYHPGMDVPVGWTPDGKAILFRSGRKSYARFRQLFTIPVEGGNPSELPLPMAEEGSFSPDGKRIAYVPFWNRSNSPLAHVAWKRYRGGLASPVWIADLADSAVVKLPREKSNDFNPMWVGHRVYFLSDRAGPVTLFAYDVAAKRIEQLLPNSGPDIKSASAGPGAIVYDQFGELHLYDLETKKANRLEVRVAGDLLSVRPRFEKVAKKVQEARLSPTGARAVFEARGEILTVPADKGDIRNLTRTPGVAERDPSWSPDGQTLAYFSDESGEYQLHLRPQNGLGEVKKYALGRAPSFYYAPVWSPDSKKIAYTDKRLNFWFIDLETGQSTSVDTAPYAGSLEPPSWSPDGKWLAYVKKLKSSYSAVFLYSLAGGKHHQVTDGFSDASNVAFDRGGKYLYFLTSTDAGPATMAGMSTYNRGVTRGAYLVVLSKDDPSPLAPDSDEEKKESSAKDKEKDKDKPKGKEESVKVRIDLEDIDQRILAMPILARNYTGLLAGKAGIVFLLEGAPIPRSDDSRETGPGVAVHRFELEKRKSEKLVEGARHVAVSHNGEKMLYQQGEGWFVVAAAKPPKSGEGALKLDGLEVRVDPRAEWRQIYREVWRIERDFLYDPNFHGYDLKAAEQHFHKYLPGIASRYDLNYLLEEMLGELSLGHVYISGGDVHQAQGPKAGLLGADYRVENGSYRFARIYRGENWNPRLRAPLTQPGMRVKEGEYLLAVDGRDVRADDEVYAAFEGKAGKAVVLRVGPNVDGTQAREVTVIPVGDEYPLRHLAWVEDNRRKVEKLSGGRVAYIYIPDTATGGFTRFNREFFAQAGKDGAVVDERFNGGGNLADHVVDYLRQPLRNYIASREGEDLAFPTGAIFGPKVMIINEQAGSGGDYMPYIFRQSKVGTLIGKRTWGGLVGIGGYPELIDGGSVTAPRMAIWFPNGQWDVENVGVSPDVEVEFDPKAVRAGHDPQLEKAVELVLEELRKNPPTKPRRPAFPNYHVNAALKEDLLAATRKGDAEAVEALLTKGADVNAKADYGVTPLALAADKGHVEVVKVLLRHKADVNSKDTFYQATPLAWASMRSRAAVAALLVEAGAEGAEGVLSSAASRGQADMVRALLEKKKFKQQTLDSALAAAAANKKEIAELLKKAGAKLPAKPKSTVERSALAAYAGTYRSDQGEIKLTAEDGKLVGSTGGTAILTLTAVDKTTFKPAGTEGVVISFSRDGDKVTGFSLKRDKTEVVFKRVNDPATSAASKPAVVEEKPRVVTAPSNWPSFRGPGASGVADGQFPPTTWDAEKGSNIRWKTPIPGLGHSCPVVWEGRLFVTTAVSGDPKATFRPGQYGDVDSVEDKTVHTWNVYCLDKKTGQVLWERTTHQGVPKQKRHLKSTHANPTPAVDAGHVVVSFGSEGLYCFDHQGKQLWRRDLGTLASGWFYDGDYQWGFGSSPVIYRDRVIVQCDVGKGSFLAAFRLADGGELWRTPREEIPSWGTPTIVEGPERVELVTNATKFARGYDPLTGKELWRLGRHAEITVPTPFYAQGLIFVTSGYAPVQPIYAIRPGAKGDITLKKGKTSNDSIAWSTEKGGPYMPTPVAYGDYLYICSNAGMVTCFEARTGKQVYKERLGGRGGYTASPVAADGKLYFSSEEDGVRVVAAGPKFHMLSVNPLGDPCMASPAISDGMLFIRTQHYVLGIGRK